MSATLVALAAVVAVAEPEPLPWRHTLFLQFDGASLTWVPSPDEENAALGLSFLSKFEGSEIPAYDGDAADRQAVVDAVRGHFAGAGVRVVDERPPEWVPYTMAVVGGQWDDTAATSFTRGTAPEVDCERLNQRHVVFAFVSSTEPSVQQATTISQEAGHAWGLDHVLGDGLVMSYDFAALVSEFSDGCVPLCEEACQGRDSIYCEAVHADFCDEGMQDSWAELLYTFGDDTLDEASPTVDFLHPTEGDVFPPGEDLLVDVDVTDDYGGVGWRFELRVDGREVASQTAFERELQWPLASLPEGAYELRIIAEDHADHVTMASVAFEVGEVAADSTGAGGTTATDASSTPSWANADDSTGAAAGDDSGGGCTCRADAPPLGALSYGWLVLVAGWRRRRVRVRPLQRDDTTTGEHDDG
ncbi:MAG: Ig-like domain-containing protein [Myxococcota bacterium]